MTPSPQFSFRGKAMEEVMNHDYRTFFFISAILFNHLIFAQTAKLTGYIFDQETQKPIPDANITIANTSIGAVSRHNGYYELTSGNGLQIIQAKVIGYKPVRHEINLDQNTTLNFNLQAEPIQLDRICVTATRYNHLQSQVTVSSDIVPVSIAHGVTAGEQLTAVPGLIIKNHGGMAGVCSPTLRGASNEQVLIMLDGIRLNTAQGTPLSLNNFPAFALDRIEVIRGGHSALMGSNALGGVINLISKQPVGINPFSASIQSTAGSFGTYIYSISGAQQSGIWRNMLSFHKAKSDGDFKFINPNTKAQSSRKNNDFDSHDLFIKSQINFNQRHSLQLGFQDMNSKMGSPGPLYFGQSPARLSNDRKIITLQSEHQITSNIFVEANSYYHNINREFHDPIWGANDRHRNKALGYDLKGQINILKYLTMNGGAEFKKDVIKTSQYIAQNRKITSHYLQLETFTPFSIQSIPVQFKILPAIRIDRYSDIGTHTSAKLGVMFKVDTYLTWILRGNMGQSFRAPTFDEMYWNESGEYYDIYGNLNKYSTLGNPGLKPEIGNNFDIGLTLQKSGDLCLKFESNYFRNDIENLVEWVTEYNEDYTISTTEVRNVSNAKINGFENLLFLALYNNQYTLKLGHTQLKAADQNTGLKLPNRPDRMTDIELGFSWNIFNSTLKYSIIGNRFSNANNTTKLSAYGKLNATLAAQLQFHELNLLFSIQGLNLLDETIFFTEGYPLPGREYRITIGLSY